jgi:sulfate/thiosulfate transport system ATP-binding protein
MSIRVENIAKTFGSFAALKDVTLDFPTGELTALLGPSGCGKTTLLRIIAGLETADSGNVLLNGEDASAKHVRERQVGFVFQHYALFRHMSVFENIAFGLRVKPRRERPDEATIRKKVNNLLELVQLGGLAHRAPAQLSGGQRQRVALARALAVEPQVLLLDEPFGALDAKVRKELRAWLRQLHDELHITSLFVTHDQEEALELADRVVLMNAGRVEQIGTSRQVYAKPASAFVFGFLGTSNRLNGTITNGALVVDGIPLPLSEDAPTAEGAAMIAFIRPHDLAIFRSEQPGSLPASIRRVLDIGPLARVELISRPQNGAAPHPLEVELPHAAIAPLTLSPGEAVWLVPSRVHVFPQG